MAHRSRVTFRTEDGKATFLSPDGHMFRIVKVVWVDPQLLNLQGLVVVDDLEGLSLHRCMLVGHLVKETDDCLFVAKELWDDGSFKYVHMIPKKIVEEVHELK